MVCVGESVWLPALSFLLLHHGRQAGAQGYGMRTEAELEVTRQRGGAVQRCEGLEVDESKCVSLVSAHGWLDLETDSDDDLLHLFLGLQVRIAVCFLSRENGSVGCIQRTRTRWQPQCPHCLASYARRSCPAALKRAARSRVGLRS